MKKLSIFASIFTVILFTACSVSAQIITKATDFTVSDCAGAEHHLFESLDKGGVVMIEFVMGCLPCVQGGTALASIHNSFEVTNPGKVQVFTFGYSANADCDYMKSWMTTNKLDNPTFGGDDTIITSYGAEGGMPTIAVVGGTDHKVLYWKKGFAKKDTVAIKTAIAKGLNSSASVSSSNLNESIKVYPNPASSKVSVEINCKINEIREISLFNAEGVKLFSIFDGNLSVGKHSIDFSTDEISAGKYFIHATTKGSTLIMPLTVVR